MTTGDFMSGTSDCCGDAAAYLLGGLEPSETARFCRHLEDCAVCRDELAGLRAVVDVLPLCAPQHRAPRALRRRVMRDVRSQPAATAGGAARRYWRPSIQLGLRLALAGAVAAVVALATVGGVELSSGGSGMRVVRASVTGVPGSAQVRIVGGHAELIVSHLAPPPAGRIYEVWVKRGERPPSPTRVLFSVTASGAADVGVPANLDGVNAIMVTPEPAGGSLVPTHDPVIVARIA
jgi:anti-sigma-K factor RskA